MPFTFSHPAIVLPLAYLPKKSFSLTALIVGSMAPDFEYFLRMRVNGTYGHTVAGMFWFDLPLGILLALAFHNLVREALISNLPSHLQGRFAIYAKADWNAYFREHFIVVICSMLIGVASHLFWDSFTHEHGYFVQRISILKQIAIQCFPWYRILQHLSTLSGALVICFAIYKMPVYQAAHNKILGYWLTIMLVAGLIFCLRMQFTGSLGIGSFIASVIASVLLSLIIVSLVWTKKHSVRN
ncbi:DUF4184 domain-containing protein [Flavobacterium magnum]|uniref:DUF4184 domain-containing protein n=1 Tax=Flavobacterium magnum TaxID=2162713 RepID=A0A2S0RFF6_9FLAO|nr:DUF4184 family protein [Flavobacterium magnum]AWA30355.1 DUF4184 domain-containing protein [Flavobacterium magnum]